MSDSLDGSTHSYAATGLPTGLKINSGIGASTVSITTAADPTNNEIDSVSLALTATDGSGSTLVFEATGLPAGLRLNSSIQ